MKKLYEETEIEGEVGWSTTVAEMRLTKDVGSDPWGDAARAGTSAADRGLTTLVAGVCELRSSPNVVSQTKSIVTSIRHRFGYKKLPLPQTLLASHATLRRSEEPHDSTDAL